MYSGSSQGVTKLKMPRIVPKPLFPGPMVTLTAEPLRLQGIKFIRIRRYALARFHPRGLVPVMAAYRMQMERSDLRALLEQTWISQLRIHQRRRILYRVLSRAAAEMEFSVPAPRPPKRPRKAKTATRV